MRRRAILVVAGAVLIAAASGCVLDPPPPPPTTSAAFGVYGMPVTNQVPIGQGGRTYVYAPLAAVGRQIRLVWGCGYTTLSDTTVTLTAAAGLAPASIPIPPAILTAGYYYCTVWETAPSGLPAATGRAFIQWSDSGTWMVDITHGVTGHPAASAVTRSASWQVRPIYYNDGIEPVPIPWNDKRRSAHAAGQRHTGRSRRDLPPRIIRLARGFLV